jgi:two-component system, NtrC family, nitrogen regulation sensor histidine kinase NtrY
MGSRSPANAGSSAPAGPQPAGQGPARAAPTAGPPAPPNVEREVASQGAPTGPEQAAPDQRTAANAPPGKPSARTIQRVLEPRPPAPRKWSLSLERRIHLLCALLAAPGLLFLFLFLWKTNTPGQVMAGVLAFLTVFLLIVLGAVSEQVVRPLQTLANVVASLREGDYSFRARNWTGDDALSEVALEINQLADMMQGQRLGELEATALLRNVMRSMDAPVLAFDPGDVLRLINPAGERLLGLVAERALGRNADELRLAELLSQPDQGILVLAGRRNSSRWMVRRSTFRQRGVPHTLLILSDVSVALREQEREAWQRLIRVLGHEINNSLTPIKSIAATLRSRAQVTDLAKSPDLDRALKIIESRADSLNRFIQAYRQLAQLPQPVLLRAPLRPLLERLAALETRVPVRLEPGPELFLNVDSDQVEQLMINLIRNAAEASLARFTQEHPGQPRPEVQPEVRVSWRIDGEFVEIVIADNGAGLSNPSNLFVPFYTTKAGGTGVGLALARQICEAHGGAIHLTNRLDAPGCEAHVRFRLPAGDSET